MSLKKEEIISKEKNGVIAGCWKDKRKVRFL